MASVPTTCALGCFIERGRQVKAGNGQLVLVLAKSIGAATDSILRDCDTLDAMITAGLVLADFTGYAPKILGAPDFDIQQVKGTSPRRQSLVPSMQVWNPAGGGIQNTPVKSVLLHRADTGTPQIDWFPLGINDASGGTAAGGSYSHTFAPLNSQAA